MPSTAKNLSSAGRIITREKLASIALTLFQEKGVAETSVNDIVKRAEIAKGTFYLYFGSRDELVDTVFDRYRNSFLKEVVLKNSDSPEIIFFAASILDYFTRNRLFLTELRKSILSSPRPRYTERILSAFTQVIINYFKRDERYTITRLDHYSEIIMSSILEICHKYLVEESIESREEASQILQDYMKRFFDCE